MGAAIFGEIPPIPWVPDGFGSPCRQFAPHVPTVPTHAPMVRTSARAAASDLGEVGVESRTDGGSQPGFAVFGGEDEMHHHQGERLWFSVGPDDGLALVLR